MGIGIDAGHTNIRLTSSLLVHHFMSGGINQAPSICRCQSIMSGGMTDRVMAYRVH